VTRVLKRGGIALGAVIKEYLQGVSIFTVPRLTVSGLIVPTSEEAPFFIRVQLNPGNQVAESDFRNNIAKCKVYDYGRFVIADQCWIENCESGVDTHGGNSNGDCCVFPFKFNGKLYHSCTTDGLKQKWCSTTYSFSRDKKWGLCFN